MYSYSGSPMSLGLGDEASTVADWNGLPLTEGQSVFIDDPTIASNAIWASGYDVGWSAEEYF